MTQLSALSSLLLFIFCRRDSEGYGPSLQLSHKRVLYIRLKLILLFTGSLNRRIELRNPHYLASSGLVHLSRIFRTPAKYMRFCFLFNAIRRYKKGYNIPEQVARTNLKKHFFFEDTRTLAKRNVWKSR